MLDNQYQSRSFKAKMMKLSNHVAILYIHHLCIKYLLLNPRTSKIHVKILNNLCIIIALHD